MDNSGHISHLNTYMLNLFFGMASPTYDLRARVLARRLVDLIKGLEISELLLHLKIEFIKSQAFNGNDSEVADRCSCCSTNGG